MTKTKRRLLAAGIGIGLIFMGVLTFMGLLLPAVMGTDACSDLPDWTTYYLFILWPLTLLTGSIVPAWLVWVEKPWYWALIGFFVCAVINGLVFVGWFLILGQVC